MKCSHCGAEFEGNFCTACGAKAEPCPQPSPEIPTDRPRSQKPKKASGNTASPNYGKQIITRIGTGKT